MVKTIGGSKNDEKQIQREADAVRARFTVSVGEVVRILGRERGKRA